MIRLSALLISIFFSLQLLSQKYSFIEYSTSEGLPQSQVNDITQDRSGYLWMATLGGLAKFDGKNFTTYGTSDGLLNNRIVELSIISDELYVGHDTGISYTNKSDSFNIALYPRDIPPANVTAIIEYDGQVYVGTNGSGLFLFDSTSTVLKSIPNSPSRIREIVITENKVILATRNGIYISNDGHSFQQLEGTQELSFSSIIQNNKRLLATTYSGLLLELDQQRIIDTILSSPEDPFRSIMIDDTERIWLNSRNGLISIDKQENLYLSEQNGLPLNDINTVFQDREGNIWFGSGGKGLIRFTGEVFMYYGQNDLIPSNLVISMVKDNRGDYWFSSLDKGVFKVSKDGSTTPIEYINSSVWSIDLYEETIVFGSNFGLHVNSNGRWSSFYEEDGLSSNRITGVKKYTDSSFLIGTSKGIEVFNTKTNTFKHLVTPDHKYLNVRDFVIQKDSIYFAAQSGVYLIVSGGIQSVYQFDASINCIVLDNDNNLCVGTENGLYILTSGEIRRKYLENKNRNDYVNFIQKIDHEIFVGTLNGLYEIDPNKSFQYNYDINSGLIDLETNLNSFMFDKNTGLLWFGTASGLMTMDISERKTLFESVSPKLQLTAVKVNFKPLEKSSIYNKDNIQSDILSLPYRNNNIEFEFDGIYLSNPSSLKYQYFLEGFSTEWSPLMNNSDINFTNLPPGDFTLRFRVQNEIGLFSEEWITRFEVLPPFYRTWWFYSLCLLLILIILFVIDRIRVVRLARKNYQLRLEFENKLSKLEQQSLNASMNRHFIFNSLNSIQYYINSSDKQSANKYLSRFAKLIRKNLDSSHRKDGMVPLGDEIERLKLYLDLESMRFKDKFDYSIEIEPQVEVELLKVPAMFLQPFVENSIIHGILPLKDRKGLITLSISDHLEYIKIEIKDNGVGIEQSVNHKPEHGDHESQGMLITKGRIELLQKISAKSIEMIGPHQINEHDTSVNGTIVIFKLIKQYLD